MTDISKITTAPQPIDEVNKINEVIDEVGNVAGAVANLETALQGLLSNVYPVGSIYIGTQSTCPLSELIADSTWELVSSGKALWTGDGTNADTTVAAVLPNITGTFASQDMIPSAFSGAFTAVSRGNASSAYSGVTAQYSANFDASRSSSIYGNSDTVQPPAYIVNVWKRTA